MFRRSLDRSGGCRLARKNSKAWPDPNGNGPCSVPRGVARAYRHHSATWCWEGMGDREDGRRTEPRSEWNVTSAGQLRSASMRRFSISIGSAFIAVLLIAAAPARAQEAKDDTILLTIFLRHDQSKP